MLRASQLKILVGIQVFFRLCNVILSDEKILESMSLADRESVIRTKNVQECQTVQLERHSWSKKSGKTAVNITFNDSGTQLTVTLYVVEDDDLISRRRTGVWRASLDTSAYRNVFYSPEPQIFDVIGDFKLFQNVKEGSAIAKFFYFNGSENIVGILKKIYTVKTIGRKQFLVSICKNAGILQEYIHRYTYENDTLPDPNLHRQNMDSIEVPDVVYPKLLVLPDFNWTMSFSHDGAVVMQLIARLNCIDMMFRQLRDPKIHLNIAGIILPSDSTVMSYISRHIDPQNKIYGPDAVRATRINFRDESRRFPNNKWDAILVLTTYPISLYSNEVGGLVEVNGFSQPAHGCLNSVAIARITEEVESIYTLAHELGNMFSKRQSEDGVTGQCENFDSYRLGSAFNYSDKLEWSNCNRAAFQTFFRSTAGNCTHFQVPKVPDTIKSMPGTWLSLAGQCDNLYKVFTVPCKWEVVHGCVLYGCEADGLCEFIDEPLLTRPLIYHRYRNEFCINETTIS